MKHLLNDMTEEEKNSIREQHKGGMKVQVEKFNQLIESTLGDVKPFLNEMSAESLVSLYKKFEGSITEDDKKKLESCIQNYPQLKSVMGSLGMLGMGAVLALFLILAFGMEVSLGSIILIFLSTVGVGIDIMGVKEILKDVNKNKLVAEAKKVLECASINLYQYGI